MEPTTIGILATSAAAWFWSNYRKKVTDAAVLKLGSSVTKATLDVAKTAWAKFDWNRAAQSYREEMYRQYGTTRVLGKPDPILLEDIFTDVYILSEPSAFKRFDIAKLQTDPNSFSGEHNRVNGLRLVKRADSNRLFILGKPGAGKTTFLRYITLQAAQGYLDRVPIFVSLKAWSDSGHGLIAFLDKQFEICGFPDATPFVRHVLEEGHALILFDGLDEVSQEEHQRDHTIWAMRDFCRQFRKSQVLITCRIAATDYTFQEFKYVELADFTEKQIEIYVSHWFRDSPEKLRRMYSELNKEENKGLRELARIPLLLGLLCLSFDATMTFPQRRVEIYEEALEALLKRWDSSRSIKRDEIYQGLSLGRKRQMFSRIAARTFQDNLYFIPKDLLADYVVDYVRQLPRAPMAIDIDGEAVVEAIEAQHGVFTERANRIYSFSHLTFQEYFTAKHVVDDSTGEAIHELLSVRNIGDTRWREVIVLVASLLNDADLFFQLFLRSLSSLIKESQVRAVLRWTHDKVMSVSTRLPAPVCRFVYLFLELTATSFSSDRFLRANRAVYSLGDSMIPIPEIKQALQQVLNIPNSEILTNDRNLTRNIASSCTRSLDRAHYLSLHLGTDLAIDSFLYSQLLLANQLKHFETKSSRRLESVFKENFAALFQRRKYNPILRIPASLLEEIRNNQSWDEISLTLRTYTESKRNIGKNWALSDSQLHTLSEYVNASRLMNDCLRLAVVPDRSSLVKSYCLPPELWAVQPTLI